MALSQTTLKNSLTSWLQNKSNYSSISQSMSVFIDAYETYALSAIDISGDGLLTYFKSNALSLLNTITNNDTATTAAQKIENAIKAFWTAATFKLTIPPAGTILPEISAIVTTNIISGTLATLLLTIFNSLNSSETDSSKANDIATALHTSTKTIIVTCIGTLSGGGTLAVPGVIS
ncbi:MAG: hypothetical protein PHF86_14065 [Candidatus Nanoarchaeia archaeon]|jgi:hypothetical protein|nr:hypothetical protein [Candidatus Nanoarchaeia archaeon]